MLSPNDARSKFPRMRIVLISRVFRPDNIHITGGKTFCVPLGAQWEKHEWKPGSRTRTSPPETGCRSLALSHIPRRPAEGFSSDLLTEHFTIFKNKVFPILRDVDNSWFGSGGRMPFSLRRRCHAKGTPVRRFCAMCGFAAGARRRVLIQRAIERSGPSNERTLKGHERS